MARNKSERLPSCPALYGYAKRCLEVLDDPLYSDGSVFSPTDFPWLRVPLAVRHKCVTVFRQTSPPEFNSPGAETADEYVRRWRKFIIAYAKENYGP